MILSKYWFWCESENMNRFPKGPHCVFASESEGLKKTSHTEERELQWIRDVLLSRNLLLSAAWRETTLWAEILFRHHEWLRELQINWGTKSVWYKCKAIVDRWEDGWMWDSGHLLDLLSKHQARLERGRVQTRQRVKGKDFQEGWSINRCCSFCSLSKSDICSASGRFCVRETLFK